MTEQVQEKLRYHENEYWIDEEPLRLYLEQHPKITFEATHSACWRGYQGTWELKGSPNHGIGLYLVELEAYQNFNRIKTLQEVFPDTPHGLFAHWFNGTLHCSADCNPRDQFTPFFEPEEVVVLEFHQGLLVNESILHHTA